MQRKRRARDDIRATIDVALDTAESIAEIERRKRELDPEDPKTLELSTKSAALGARLAATTQAEAEIAEELATGEPDTD